MQNQGPDTKSVSTAIYNEILGVMGLRGKRWALPPLRWVFGPAVRKVSTLLAELDREIARCGWYAAMQAFSRNFVRGVKTSGAEYIPEKGPLIAVSNHPGAYDVIALSAAIPRDDLKIVSSDVAFIRCLPAVYEHFIPLARDTAGRSAVVRSALRHLNAGGALLIFPRGEVEPDPALWPESSPDFERWSPSIELMARKTLHLNILAALSSAMLSRKWFYHPIPGLWKKPEQRQKIAEIFQAAQSLLASTPSPVDPCIAFARPFGFSEREIQELPRGALMQRITGAVRSLSTLK
ncbi:MAG: hypothetical protein EHM70_14545 [Chloroflexota bacterium]|nr:MAG: hypothetical protein EHM70_14545 [Chloroflexota bacterium]